MTYPKVILKQGKEKSVLNRHPWIYSGAIAKNDDVDVLNPIVEIFSYDQLKLGYGFFDKNSQIAVRLFHFENEYCTFDENFWNRKFEKAYVLRKQLLPSKTTIYRLIYAEGDELPGLIVDVYNDCASVQLLSEFAFIYLPYLENFFSKIGISDFYLKKNKTALSHLSCMVKEGWKSNEVNKKIIAQENGLFFEVDVENGQKTGFFIDQRDNRNLIGNFVYKKTVLNAFSFTGSFSVYALANGAEKVISVDISKTAISGCQRNIELNMLANHPHESLVADCFDYLKNEHSQFDVVIIDPPAFAKNAKSVSKAARGYKELNMQALKRTRSKGFLFTFSCSQHIDKILFQKIIFGAAADVKKNVKILKWLTQPFDHPVNIFHPEGEYLKGLLLYVD